VIRRANDIPGVPKDQDLVIRAAQALKQATGSRLGADITVTKRIPMGGGLGGGSSDAATVLMALNHLWGTGLTRARLMEVGLKLGADVPFFIFGDNAFVTGIGEQMQALALPQRWFVVLKPAVSVPTVEIFRSPDLTRDTKPVRIAVFPADELSFPQTRFANDLQSVASAKYPAVAQAVEWLRKHDDRAAVTARMTGSGACVFAGFAEQSAAEQIYEQRPEGVDGFVARSLVRHPLADLVGEQ
jgi:4-diphosphocytidyl-2-C-methyl-D-erythritol kinase